MIRSNQLIRVREPLLVVFSLAMTAFIWEMAGQAEVSRVFPPFTDVMRVSWDVWTGDRFLDAAWYSIRTLVVVVPISLGSGLVVGVLMGRFKVVEWALDIWVNIFISLPLIALIPVILLIFGVERQTMSVIVFLSTFFVVVVNTSAGIRAVSGQYDEMARAFGSSPMQTLLRIHLPGALPLMLTGVRLATGRSIRSVIYAEQIIGIFGVGGLLSSYGSAFKVEETWALIIAVGVTSLIAMEAVRVFEGWMLRVFPQGQSAGSGS
jgi:NitT/TauT family transport system permease protein